MRWTYIVLSGALLAMLPLGANAEFYSGNKLKDFLEKWESSSPGLDGAIGAGYVAGVYDSRVSVNFCPPSGVTLGQLTAMVLKRLKENPDKLHLSGDVHVILALRSAWPCAERQQGTDATPTPPTQRPAPKAKPRDQDTSPF